MSKEEKNGDDKEPKGRKRLSAVERIILQAIGDGKVLGLAEDPAREKFPALWEWLTRVYCGKDNIKQPAILTVLAVNGGWTFRVADRDLASAMTVTVKTLEEGFAALEQVVADPSSPIQSWGRKEANLRKRKTSN